MPQQPDHCYVTTESGRQQDIYNLTTMPCVQRSLYLNEVTNDFGNMKVEVPKGVDGQTRDLLERCMASCGRAAGTAAKRDPVHVRKHQLKKYEILQTVC